ncbi:MAG TPA: AbrB/MazE/SpoVT family DNA-binding domain-containing protein [Candidatus Babeliales bacterium]|nr:AbrB/MazE/SpoVT family DNA-binding domain-containing protein [Candidatus Babeliales bacterium]
MLKKLVKYGNSNALILDKAIMELLNMKEGSVVKFKTDGKSLIITPVEGEKASSITLNANETLMNINAEKTEAAKADPDKKHVFEEWAPGTENFSRLTEALAPIMAKNAQEISVFGSPAFMVEADALAAKHHGDRSSSKAFMKDLIALQDKYAPGYYNKAQQEMREAYKKVGYPMELFAADNDWD